MRFTGKLGDTSCVGCLPRTQLLGPIIVEILCGAILGLLDAAVGQGVRSDLLGARSGAGKPNWVARQLASEFELQIRADEVISAAKFSLAIYAEFNREWRQQIAWPAQVLSSIGTNLRFSGPM